MSQYHDLIKNDPRWKAARAECLDRDDHTCQRCGSTEEVQADHIVPLASCQGDLDRLHELAFDLANLQALCRRCNRAKSSNEDQVTVRLAWSHPDWPELADLVASF